MPDPTSAPVTAEDLCGRIIVALHGTHPSDWIGPAGECKPCRARADAVVAALVGDPGDLPARMAAEMMYHHPTDRTASACTCGAREVFGWGEHVAAAAMSVRWEDVAGLAAENARLQAALTESQGNASAYHEHMVTAQGDRDRHRAGMQAATERAELADVEVERLRATVASLEKELGEWKRAHERTCRRLLDSEAARED